MIGTGEFLLREPPMPDTGVGRSSLERNLKKLAPMHIFNVELNVKMFFWDLAILERKSRNLNFFSFQIFFSGI